MSVEITWAAELCVRLIRLYGVVNIEDVETMIEDNGVMLDASTQPLVHFVVDASAMTSITANIVKMPAILNGIGNPKLGWVGIVGITPLISFWVEILRRAVGLRFKLFPTVEDATEFMLELVRIARDESQPLK